MKPSIFFINPTPANNSYLSINYTNITISVGDTNSNINSALLEWNGTNYSMQSVSTGEIVTFFKNMTNLIDGNHNYKVYAKDSFDNFNVTENRILTIDTINPIINITSHSEGFSTTASYITVTSYVNGTGSAPSVTVKNVNALVVNNTYKAKISLSSGSNAIYANVTDQAGNTNSSLINVTRTSDGGSSGGGGGGGGTSGEAFENIVCTETDRQFVGKDLNVKYNFKLKGNYVQHIQFTGLTGAGKVAAKVEILNHTSTIVKKDAPNIVFKNLNVWIGNMGYFSNNNIKDPTITFIVDRSWVRDNDIILNTISFYSYNDRTRIWEKMSTQKIGEDSTSYLFKASLPIRGSLGPMAISGKDLVYVPTHVPTSKPVITPTQSVTDQPTPEITPTTIPVTWTGTWNAKVPGFQLLAALIPLITLYFISRRRD